MEDKNVVKQQFVELRSKGNSYDRIASKLNVSKSALIEWSRLLSM
jgi:transposase